MTQKTSTDFVVRMEDEDGTVHYFLVSGGTGFTLEQARERGQRWADQWKWNVTEVGVLERLP